MKQSKIVSGVKWTALSSLVVVVVQTLQIIIVSRFLTKEEFGIASLVLVMSGFAQIFIDFGISNALISKKEISKKEIDGLFWLTLIISFIVFVLFNVLSPLISGFYEIKEIGNLIFILSLSILFSGVSSLYKSLKQRDLDFNYMAVMDVLGVVIGLIISSLVAYNGGGAYSLIFAICASSCFVSILYIINGLSKFGFPKSFIKKIDLEYYIKFGVFQLGEKFLIYFNSQADLIIIGKIMNTDIVGTYSIAKQLSMKISTFFNAVVSRVTLPILAIAKNDNNKIRLQYINSVSILTFFLAPVLTLVIINAEFIIKILFGDQWLDVVIILQIMCVYLYFRTVGSPVGALILAFNKPQFTFYWNLMILVFFPLLVFYFGLKGIKELCYALVIYSVLIKVPEYFFLVKKVINLSLYQYFDNFFRSFILSLASTIVLYFLFYTPNFIFNSFIYLFVYFLFCLFLNKKQIRLIVSLLRN